MENKITFLDLVRKRHSVRNYIQKPVDRDIILRAIEAARLAPSACNSQPWYYIVVDEPARVKKLAMATSLTMTNLNKFVEKAPVIIAVVSEKPNISSGLGGMIKNKPYYLMDIGISVENFCLQAAEDSLGTCILGWFNEKKVKKFLGVPASKGVPLLITLGYPENNRMSVRHRRDLEDMYSFNSFKS